MTRQELSVKATAKLGEGEVLEDLSRQEGRQDVGLRRKVERERESSSRSV